MFQVMIFVISIINHRNCSVIINFIINSTFYAITLSLKLTDYEALNKMYFLCGYHS